MSTLPQQPSRVTEILIASFKLYAESFTKVMGYSLLVFAINRLLAVFVMDSIPSVDSTLTPDAQMTAMLQVMPSLLAVSGVVILFSCVFYSGTLYRIDNVARGREDNFVEVLGLALKKFPTIIFSMILYAIAITVGTFLLLIPGIILMISLAFCWYFILLEDLGAYDSLVASHRLVWGNWWRTNIVFFVPSIIFLLVFFGINFLSVLMTGSNAELFNIGSELLSALITPYFYVIGYLQYHDLKLRKLMSVDK